MSLDTSKWSVIANDSKNYIDINNSIIEIHVKLLRVKMTVRGSRSPRG